MGRETSNGDTRKFSLVLEMAVASAIKLNNGTTEIQIVQTDEGLELSIDLVEAQVVSQLFASPTGPANQMGGFTS